MGPEEEDHHQKKKKPATIMATTKVTTRRTTKVSANATFATSTGKRTNGKRESSRGKF